MKITEICPGVTRFHDETDASFYLIAGENKALAIDTGTGRAPVLPLLRAHIGRPGLPIELAVTHAHGDHYGGAHAFDTVYMHPADIAVLPSMQEYFSRLMGVRPPRPETLRPLRGGEEIDLGGVRVLALELAGHTPGSLVFVDAAHRQVFTGDAAGAGTGVWMQVIHSLPVAAYRENLARFCEAAKPYAGFTVHGGHHTQAGEEGTDRYNPPCIALMEDMIALCDRVLAGADGAAIAPGLSFTTEPAAVSRYGRATMVYMPDRLFERPRAGA